MKRLSRIVFLIALLPMAAQASFFDDAPQPSAVSAAGTSFETAFSPGSALSPLVVKELGSAQKSIRVASRQFVSKPVSEALVKAMRAKVDIKVVLNRKTNQGVDSAGKFMAIMSVPPHLSKSEDGLYAEYIIVDDRDIILGNIAGFMDEEDEKSKAGEVIVIHNAPDLARQYLAQWQTLWDASEEMKTK